MPEGESPPGRRQPSTELEEILAQGRRHWQGLNAGPILGFVALVVVIVLWSSWFTVQPEETGIVQRFGRVVRTASPGLHFKWPYGIETADEEEMLKEIPAEREEEIKKEITRAILTEARKIIPQYGIELIDVRIKRLDYIESVREKVYARMISERKRIAAQFRSEGEGWGAEILGTMEKDWREIRSSAYRQV